jgi:hypothetical protein
MPDQEAERKSLSRYAGAALLCFLGLALLFIFFKGPVTAAAKFLLLYSGEISPARPKVSEAPALQADKLLIEQAKELNKKEKISLSKKKPEPAQKTAAAPVQTAETHKGRTAPALTGYYTLGDKVKDNSGAMAVNTRERVVYKPENWSGPDDCSAMAWLDKSDKGITVFVEVTDDKLVADSKQPWENDAVELYFDLRPKNSRGEDKYDKGVFQLIAVPCFSKTMANRANFYGGGSAPLPVPGVKVQSKVIPKGYIMQIFLPYEGLKSVHYAPGDEFNFDFAVDDNDGDQSKRKQIMWSGTSDNCKGAKWFGRMKPVTTRQESPAAEQPR